jgi:FKBP-type peptidyl-prolyl cis-trans isomerase
MKILLLQQQIILVFWASWSLAWQPNGPSQCLDRRRAMIHLGSSVFALVAPSVAQAGIDPTLLKSLPVQGDESGAAQRLRQVEAVQKPASDLVDIPFIELPSGVSYREYRDGRGEAGKYGRWFRVFLFVVLNDYAVSLILSLCFLLPVVKSGSKVAVEMTVRCKSFSTVNEPGGVKYFSTKDDTEFNELAWTIGDGALLPGLEEGMAGMHKNALRRIEIPATMVFAARKANQLPLPTTKDGKRRFESLFKTDATLLFEVLVTRVK